MKIIKYGFIFFLGLVSYGTMAQTTNQGIKSSQYITVLGIAQDGGYPQAGCTAEHCLRHWRGEEGVVCPIFFLQLKNHPFTSNDLSKNFHKLS